MRFLFSAKRAQRFARQPIFPAHPTEHAVPQALNYGRKRAYGGLRITRATQRAMPHRDDWESAFGKQKVCDNQFENQLECRVELFSLVRYLYIRGCCVFPANGNDAGSFSYGYRSH